MIALLAQLALLCADRGHRPRVVKVRDLSRPTMTAGRRVYPRVLRLELRCRRCGTLLDVREQKSWERVPCDPPGPLP